MVAAGTLDQNVAATCGGNPDVCCPNGIPAAACGPLRYDFTMQPGDSPRLVITPDPGSGQEHVVLRARLTSATPVPLTAPLGIICGITIDTTAGAMDAVEFHFTISGSVAASGSSAFNIGDVSVVNMTDDDYHMTGGFVCDQAGLVGVAFDLVERAFTDQIHQNLNCDTGP